MCSLSPTGLILLDKPAGISSFTALNPLKKTLETGKIGHTGTLDPFATGLLLALVGKMTKLADLFTALDKEYWALFRFGEETDTLDTEGKIIERGPIPNEKELEEARKKFIGSITQYPPQFSAIKIKGERAYQRARRGEKIEMPQREIVIYKMEFLSWNPPYLELKILCSKGSYIRSIARDLAKEVGSRAHCYALKRTKIGPFSLEQSFAPKHFQKENILETVSSLASLGIPSRSVDSSAAHALKTGIDPSKILGDPLPKEKMVLWLDEKGNPVVLTTQNEGHYQYKIVFD